MKQKLYTDSPLRIPFPVYLVFYNGSMEEPERKEILLSDLFIQNGKGLQPALECTALLLNINLGHNQELMEKKIPGKKDTKQECKTVSKLAFVR